MRKLKLQMQLSLDGFVAGPNGEMDWMEWDWDEEIKKVVNELTAPVDCILLGRKMTDGFIKYWASASMDPNNPEYPFAKKMCDTPKVVFSRTLKKSEWENTILAGQDIVKEVNKLKTQQGGDIIAYGGAGFVTSLIQTGLIDEYHFFINPTAISSGMTIFKGENQIHQLKLAKATPFSCGIVALTYHSK